MLAVTGGIPALALRGLVKRFAQVTAVAGVDLDVPAGSLFGLVGPNSTGMRKKIGLAVAMLHAPRLLMLDEPFEAVDPVSATTIRDILRRYVASGGTVVMSSHVMELVQRLCDHVAVINHGQIVAAGLV